MNQNRKNCAAIYTEEEYEELVLEAYWQAKDTYKQANNRYRFICIHCRESGKDKNTISHHRMFNMCKSYMGGETIEDVSYLGAKQSRREAQDCCQVREGVVPKCFTLPVTVSIPSAFGFRGG